MTGCGGRRLAPHGLALVLGLGAVVWAGPLRAQDPQVPQVLKLADALGLALRGSTQLGIEQARLDAARKQRLNAIFNLGPDLSVSALRSSSTRTVLDSPILKTITRTDSLRTVSGDTLLVVSDVGRVQVGKQDVSQGSGFRQYEVAARVRLFDGFANLARVSASNNDVRAEQYLVAYTRKQVQTNVISAYYNLLRAQLLLRVSEEAESVAREQLDRTQALFELGSAAKSDVLKSQVQQGNTRLVLVRARNQVRQARVDLEYSMNLTTATPFEIDTTVAEIRSAPVNFEEESAYALRNRENLLALRADETAASRRVWAARGSLWPSVDFQYSVTQAKQTGIQVQFRPPDSRDRSWVFSANWNLWDRYLTYAAIGQARATSRVAEYNRRQAELDAVREIRILVNDLEEARERLDVSRDNVARSQEDLRLAQEKFRVGAGTILDTITAESDLTATKAAVVQATVDYLIARASLARATGRPFSEL